MKVLKLNYNVITGSEYVWVEVPDEVVLNQTHDNVTYTKEIQTRLKLCQKARNQRQK